MNVTRTAQKLISDCQKNAAKNEYRCSTLKGIGNLSRSDLDTLVLYAEILQRDGDTVGLMELRGNLAQVWAAYGLPSTKLLF